MHFLDAIRVPTHVVEGEHGNVEDIVKLRGINENPLLRLIVLKDADHFKPLTPINELLADKVAKGHEGPLFVGTARIHAAYARFATRER